MRRAAILPAMFNPDPDVSNVEVARDVADTLSGFMPTGQTVVFLLRPDRYVAAAAAASADGLSDLATQVRRLMRNTFPTAPVEPLEIKS